MTRTLVVGDVHGCADELVEVLKSADLGSLNRIVFAGDLLDKGPDPARVVTIAREVSAFVDVVLVEGNHEQDHRRWRDAMSQGKHRRAARSKRAVDAYEVVRKLCEEDIDFLDGAVLYELLEEHNVLVAHAGVPPKMRKLPPADLDEVDALPRKRRELALAMETIRFVTPSGDVVPKGKEKKRDRFWAEVYDGRFGVVMFGHTPYRSQDMPVGFPFAIGLDLGCAVGNLLAGAILQDDRPPEYVVSPATMAANPPTPLVLADPASPEGWLGYVRVGDRMVPVSESESPEEAYVEAAVIAE